MVCRRKRERLDRSSQHCTCMHTHTCAVMKQALSVVENPPICRFYHPPIAHLIYVATPQPWPHHNGRLVNIQLTQILCYQNTIYALIFAWFIFCRCAIFAFLNSRLLGAVVLKYSQVKYLWIYGLSPAIYHNSIRQLQRCKTCWTRCWIRLKMSSYRMESCIQGFHIYKEV